MGFEAFLDLPSAPSIREGALISNNGRLAPFSRLARPCNVVLERSDRQDSNVIFDAEIFNLRAPIDFPPLAALIAVSEISL